MSDYFLIATAGFYTGLSHMLRKACFDEVGRLSGLIF